MYIVQPWKERLKLKRDKEFNIWKEKKKYEKKTKDNRKRGWTDTYLIKKYSQVVS